MDNKSSPCVLITPEELLINEQSFPIIKLKHPRAETPIVCILGPNNSLYEVLNHKEKYSSWFVGTTVVEDGGFHMITCVDPLFFVLIYLNKTGKYCPLDDCLVDAEYPDARHLSSCCTPEDLQHVTNMKSIDDLQVFSYDENKTLKWLEKKVKQATLLLKEKDICMSDGSKVETYKPVPKNVDEEDEAYCQQACHLISEYLPDELSSKMFELFSFRFEDSEIENSTEETPKEKKLKTTESVAPVEDYSKNFSAASENKNKSKLSVSQKRLMKVDKTGMKSISAFFQKK